MFPGPIQLSMLQVMKSWAGPGDEASWNLHVYLLMVYKSHKWECVVVQLRVLLITYWVIKISLKSLGSVCTCNLMSTILPRSGSIITVSHVTTVHHRRRNRSGWSGRGRSGWSGHGRTILSRSWDIITRLTFVWSRIAVVKFGRVRT